MSADERTNLIASIQHFVAQTQRAHAAPGPSNATSENGPKQCGHSDCGLWFNNQKDLEAHIKSVHNVQEPQPGDSAVNYNNNDYESNEEEAASGNNKTTSQSAKKRKLSHDDSASKNKCTICKTTHDNTVLLMNHMKIKHMNETKRCTECKVTYTSRSGFTSHMNEHTDRFQCKTCGHCAPSNSALEAHGVMHTGKKPYSCSKCQRTFTQPGSKNRHERRCTATAPQHLMDDADARSSLPSTSAPTDEHLTTTQARHTHAEQSHDRGSNANANRDDDDDATSQSSAARLNQQNSQDGSTSEKKSRGSHQCLFAGCDKWFSSRAILRRHEKTHTLVGRLVCNEPGCGKTFHRNDNFRQHQNTHTHAISYSCKNPGCTKSFWNRAQRGRHSKNDCLHKPNHNSGGGGGAGGE